MTDEIKSEIENRKKCRIRRDKTYNENTNEQYKTSKKLVKTLIKSAKVNHYKDRFQRCKLNKANIWNVINDVVPGKKNNVQNFNVETAENFNVFFANVGKNVFEEIQKSRNNKNKRNSNSSTIFPVIKQTIRLEFSLQTSASKRKCCYRYYTEP